MIMLRGRPTGIGYVPVIVGPSRPILSTRPPAPKPGRPVINLPGAQASGRPYPTAADGYLVSAQASLAEAQTAWNKYVAGLKSQSAGDPCNGFGANAGLLPLIMQASQAACEAAHWSQLAALGWAIYVNTPAAWAQSAIVQKANVAACTLAPGCADPYQESSFGLITYSNFQCVDGTYAGCVSNQMSAAATAVQAALAARALNVS